MSEYEIYRRGLGRNWDEFERCRGEGKWVVKVEVEEGRRQREVVAVVVVTFVEYARWRWEENGGRDGSRYISMAMRYGFS